MEVVKAFVMKKASAEAFATASQEASMETTLTDVHRFFNYRFREMKAVFMKASMESSVQSVEASMKAYMEVTFTIVSTEFVFVQDL